MSNPSGHFCGSGEPSLVLVSENEVPLKGTGISRQPFTFLPGEKTKETALSQDYFILATNYRLFACFSDSFFNIPIYVIDYAEIRDVVVLLVYCKDAKTFKITFECPELCTEWYYKLVKLTSPPDDLEELFAYSYFSSLTSELGNVHVSTNSFRDFSECYDIVAEKNRMGFDTANVWRLTEINTQFEICSSYPKLHLLPKWITDEEIRASSKFRSMGRFPSIVWRNKRNGAVLARSSQPELGLLGWRSNEDERLLTAIAQASSMDKDGSPVEMTTSASRVSFAGKPLLVLDARSYTAAIANRAKGGGCEYHEYYPHCEVQFMGMANIHGIRKSMQSLRNVCVQGVEQTNWYSMLESTKWLHYLSALLRSAITLVGALDKGEQSALVHCSDGWDRTTQLVALAELLLDPFYRTIQGFQVLVEREWLEFGHKFGDRCGHSTERDTNERCPVFLQWLDCVHQVARQFPTAFEYNEGFLVKLGQHAYSCLFGTFLCNNLKAKLEAKIRTKTLSVWNLMNGSRREFRNVLYLPTDKVLYPQYYVRSLVLWERMYLSATVPLKDVPTSSEDTCNCLFDSGRFTSSLASSAFTARDLRGFPINNSVLSNEGPSEQCIKDDCLVHGTEGSDRSDKDDSEKDNYSGGNIQESDSGGSTDTENKDHPSMNSSTTSSVQTIFAREDYQNALEEPIKSSSDIANGVKPGAINAHQLRKENHGSKSAPSLGKLIQSTSNYTRRFSGTENGPNLLRAKSHLDVMSMSAMEIGSLSKTNKSSTTSIELSLRNICNFIYLDGLCIPWNTIENRLYMLELNHRSEISRLYKKIEFERQQRLAGAHQSGDADSVAKDLDTQDDVVSLSDSLNERTSVSSISNEEGWEQVQYEDVQPTLWFPDHLAVRCAHCDTMFGRFMRKHHCRKCGNVFCYSCSKCCAPVPKEQLYDGVRVCVDCYETLNVF